MIIFLSCSVGLLIYMIIDIWNARQKIVACECSCIRYKQNIEECNACNSTGVQIFECYMNIKRIKTLSGFMWIK